jgi:hypothetical protein
MNETELKQALSNFYGTEGYHRYSPMFPHVILTDGAKFLAEEAGAYWLMDMISSYLPSVPKAENFVVALLIVSPSCRAHFTLQDDIPARRIYGDQAITHTDFMLDSIKLYVCRAGGDWVVMLPSEY